MATAVHAEPLIQNFEALNPKITRYRPEHLPERESELREMQSALRAAEVGSAPENLFVYGPTGQGKTLAVKNKNQAIKQCAEDNGNDVTIVHTMCKGCNSSYHVLSQLVRDLREVQHGRGEDKPKGYQKKDLFEMVVTELENIGGCVILVLDEIDEVGEDDYVLYELPRAQLKNTSLGIIGVTNDTQFFSSLDGDVRSGLGAREINFSHYNATQIQSILRRRAATALRDTEIKTLEENGRERIDSDVLESGVIPKVAGYAANETGDARHAIRLFRYACDCAYEENTYTVTEDHVEQAHERLERKAIESQIQSETTQRKLALLTVVNADINGNAPAETRDLFQTYCKFTTITGSKQLSEYSFREKLNDLVHSNILSKSRHGRGRSDGMTNTYSLASSPTLVLDAIKSNSPSTNMAELVTQIEKTTTL